MKFAEEKGLERSTVPFLVDLMSRKGVFRKKPLDERGRVARLDDLWVVRALTSTCSTFSRIPLSSPECSLTELRPF